MSKRTIFNQIIGFILLCVVVSCNSNIPEKSLSASTDSSVKTQVAKSIQNQLDILELYEDEDILSLLGASNTSGEDVVSKSLSEAGGAVYIDFCYATNRSVSENDSSFIMEKAHGLMNEEDFNRLKKEIDDSEKSLREWGAKAAKGMTPAQEEAFYKDLKSLIVKSSIMLVSAIVYVAVPTTVVWGKIPAATALSVAAGVAANSVMDIVGYFNYGYLPDMFDENNSNKVTADGDLTFQVWLDKLKESPVATHAISTAVTSYCASLGLGKIPTAIVLCMFTAYNALDAIVDMKRTYNI